MPAIMNALDEAQTVTVGGNTFHFAPRQVKAFYNNDIASVITRIKGEFGFIELPAELEYIAHLKPEQQKNGVAPEHKEILESKRKEGVEAYCRRLRGLIYNAQVSLRKDLEMANIKADPRTFASEGDVKNMEQLVKYQTSKNDETQVRVDKLKELEKKLETK